MAAESNNFHNIKRCFHITLANVAVGSVSGMYVWIRAIYLSCIFVYNVTLFAMGNSIMPYIAGLTLGFSLIMAIGSQNMYVIKQGILRQYSLCCALVCALCDAALIGLSVTGTHQLILHVPMFNNALLIMGVAFLLCYGGLSIKRACTGKSGAISTEPIKAIPTRWKTMLIALSFSLLNPHAFIDTFVVMGGMASHIQQGIRWEFALGAVTASFIWFFILVLVAMYCAPVLQRKRIWQSVEFFSGCLMLYIALHITWSVLR